LYALLGLGSLRPAFVFYLIGIVGAQHSFPRQNKFFHSSHPFQINDNCEYLNFISLEIKNSLNVCFDMMIE
jgi:hypothetical protein